MYVKNMKVSGISLKNKNKLSQYQLSTFLWPHTYFQLSLVFGPLFVFQFMKRLSLLAVDFQFMCQLWLLQPVICDIPQTFCIQGCVIKMFFFLPLLEGAARYAGLLLAPAEGFSLRLGLFLALRAKKGLFILFW